MAWTILLVVSIVAFLWIVRKVRASSAKSAQALGLQRKRETTQKDLVSQALGSRPPRREGED
jgi:hypothetical protein